MASRTTTVVIENKTTTRITFEVRDPETRRFKKYIKLGIALDEKLAKQKKSIPHIVRVSAEDLAGLKDSPLFKARQQAGDITVSPAR